MILTNCSVAAILVLVGACDRASVETKRSPAPTIGAEGRDDEPAVPTAKPASGGATSVAAKTVYVCPMHPEVVSETPGLCPKCNMRLDPKTRDRGSVERAEAPSWP